MKKWRSKVAVMLCGVMLASAALGGCGKKKDAEQSTEATTEAAQVINTPAAPKMSSTMNLEFTTRDGMYLNPYSGEWIDDEWEDKRAIGIQINNVRDCLPQHGIGDADIIFEFMVEGGITRLMAIFQDYTHIEKIGSIRSARHYYMQMASYLDLIYTHCGWSVYAEEWLQQNDLPDLNLNNYIGSYCYRDPERAGKYATEHTVFTNSESLIKAYEDLGIDTHHKANFERPFKFKKNKEPLNTGFTANKINITISNYQQPWFEYNPEDQMYYRFQYGDKHIDANTGEQLKFDSVIVLFANYWDIGDNYCWDIHYWEEAPMGYYFTEGEYIPVNWKHEEGKGFHIYTEDGRQLEQNPGKTFIEFIPAESSVTLE